MSTNFLRYILHVKGCVEKERNCLENTTDHKAGPEVIKLFSWLNSVEHEKLNAHEYKNIKKYSFCFQIQISRECYFSCS